MAELLFLNRAETQELLDPILIIKELPSLFRKITAAVVSAPPRVVAVSPKGVLGAMPGFLPEVALSVTITTVFSESHTLGLPSHQGFIVLFDEESGQPLAIMDAMEVTLARTAAASMLAIQHLARSDSHNIAVLGAGALGGTHVELLNNHRNDYNIRIASRTFDNAKTLASKFGNVEPVDTWESAVRGSDIVCCCTDTRKPVLSAEWLKTGSHISSIGGTFGHEIDKATVRRAKIFVEWRGAVTEPPPAGAHELQGLEPESVTELGELFHEPDRGRVTNDEITLYKATGHAGEDALTARLVYDRALSEGRGQAITL